MAESKMEFTTPNNTPNLAPILRLLTEVRTEIFSYLLQEVQSGFQDTLKKPLDAFVDSTTQLFQTPPTTVCRTVRYEIIEQIYRNLFWPIAFPPSTDRWTSTYAARQVGFINAIDPYVLRCVKGIQITEMRDRCQDWWRCMPFRHLSDGILIDFTRARGQISVEKLPVYSNACDEGRCSLLVLQEKRRFMLAKRLVREVEERGFVSKWKLLELIGRFREIGK